jgi:hypothetical protein
MCKIIETKASTESARSLGRFIGSVKFGIIRSIVAGIEKTAYLKAGEISC